MSDDAIEAPRKPIKVSNQAYLAFEEIMLGWIDDNAHELEFGHSGDLRHLVAMCARWASEHLKD